MTTSAEQSTQFRQSLLFPMVKPSKLTPFELVPLNDRSLAEDGRKGDWHQFLSE